MTTIRKLIEGAMRLNRVIATNETPTDADIRVGQDALATMLDSMQVDLLNIYTTTPRRFLLEAGKQTYTLGPAVDVNGNLTGADWVTERPVRVEKAVILQYPSVVYPVEPPPTVGFSRNGTDGIVVLRSAQGQMTQFTNWTGNNEALSVTANDWDVVNLPAGTTVTASSFDVPGDEWAIRSNASFSDTTISTVKFCEFVFTEAIPDDLWFGVLTNGTTAAAVPAPAVLAFDPNQGLTLETAGGQYYALFKPSTGELRNSLGSAPVAGPAGVGDVIGLRFDNYESGSPVIPCSLQVYINGVLQGSVEVPYSCYGTDRGNITAAVVKGSI